VPEDVAAAFRQTCDALTSEDFALSPIWFQTGQMKHVSTRVALAREVDTAELALAVAMFTAARPARLSRATRSCRPSFATGARFRSTTVRPGIVHAAPVRVVVRLPIVRDPARLCRVKRAYSSYYRGVERVPFEHRDDPAQFLGRVMVRELMEQVEAGACRT